MKKASPPKSGNGAGAEAAKLPELSAPDSPLIAKTIEFARHHYDACLFNHAVRSWLFASVLARAEGGKFDDEVIAISVLLHDLGLTGKFAGPHRFEVDGANAARAFARSNGVDERRAQLIWDSVALHSTPSINQYKEPEVALCGAGVAVDHSGTGIHKVPADEMAVILDAFPRMGLKRNLRGSFCRLALSKPATTYESFVSDFGERFVPGFKTPSSVDSFLNAPFDEAG